jgi:hypothetical protein
MTQNNKKPAKTGLAKYTQNRVSYYDVSEHFSRQQMLLNFKWLIVVQ